MSGFIDYVLETDYETLVAQAFANLEARFPAWVPRETQLDVAVVEETIRACVETMQVAVDVPKATFRTFGQILIGFPPLAGAAAAMTATITVIDTAGYTIPAGTRVGYRVRSDLLWTFVTTVAVSIPAGATTATGVSLVADVVGSDKNGIATAVTLELVDPLAYIASVVTSTISSGGVDGETDDAYLDRLADRLTTFADHAVTLSDYPILARNIAGIYRAAAVDGYVPSANMLDAQSADFEVDLGRFTADANTTVVRSTTFARTGAASMRLTATAIGTMSASTPVTPVTQMWAVQPNVSYVARASFRAAVTARTCTVSIVWRAQDGTAISTAASAGVTDATANFLTEAVLTATAPATAAYAALTVSVAAAAAAEVHYVDSIGLFAAPNTAWSAGGVSTLQARAVSLSAVTSSGAPISASLQTELLAYIAAKREVNFLVGYENPTYSAIAIVYNVKAAVGADPTTVSLAVNAAVTDYLNPAKYSGGSLTPARWDADPVLRFNNVVALIENVGGVAYVNTLTINGVAGDFTMRGMFPLPSAVGAGSTVTGTVTP